MMLMSKAEYAKHRNVSRQTVYAWIEKGDVVMSGNKIDVDASERMQQDHQPVDDGDRNPMQDGPVEKTWRESWDEVKSNDKKNPAPATDKELKNVVKFAAEETGWHGTFMEDEVICLSDRESEHYFQGGELQDNARLAIQHLRLHLCYSADLPRILKTNGPEREWKRYLNRQAINLTLSP